MPDDRWKHACGKAIIPSERRWLMETATLMQRDFGEPVIVNIGIFRGASMYCLRAGAPKAVLYGIDTVYPQGTKLRPDLGAIVVIANSATYHKRFRGQVHLLFIDGDHRYKGVKADIGGWAPKIAQGGMIVFHDFKTEPRVAKKHAGVRRAVLEWEKRAAQWERMKTVGSLRAYRRLWL